MPTLLQRLVGREDTLFARALLDLEQIVGNEGVDTRVIADVTHKAHDIARKLGLNPAHTAAIEIYNALRAHVASDERIEQLLATDYVLFSYNGQVVSFNLLDLLDDIQNQRIFTNRSLQYGRRALLGELTHRYVSHPRTHDPMVRTILRHPIHQPPRPPIPHVPRTIPSIKTTVSHKEKQS